MPLIRRVVRLFRADAHGLMDQLEDRGLMLKQHLREMEEALEAREQDLNRMTAARAQAGQDLEALKRECGRLDRDIDTAVARNREDIARNLIRRFAPLSRQKDDITRKVQALDEEIRLAQDTLAEQRLACDSLKAKAREYLNQAENRRKPGAFPDAAWLDAGQDIAEEEIELELLRRKEAKGN